MDEAAAEHATVFTAPGPNEATVLREFEKAFDGKLLGRTEGSAGHPNTAANEAFAVTAIQWLGGGYVRLRGSDGRRNGPGLRGLAVDPHGPLAHAPGTDDPWEDTWLSTNPIFIDVH